MQLRKPFSEKNKEHTKPYKPPIKLIEEVSLPSVTQSNIEFNDTPIKIESKFEEMNKKYKILESNKELTNKIKGYFSSKEEDNINCKYLENKKEKYNDNMGLINNENNNIKSKYLENKKEKYNDNIGLINNENNNIYFPNDKYKENKYFSNDIYLANEKCLENNNFIKENDNFKNYFINEKENLEGFSEYYNTNTIIDQPIYKQLELDLLTLNRFLYSNVSKQILNRISENIKVFKTDLINKLKNKCKERIYKERNIYEEKIAYLLNKLKRYKQYIKNNQ